jgi:hypothetical protein
MRLSRVEASGDGVFAVNTLLFIALHSYIVSNLIKPELVPLQDARGTLKAMIGPASYLAGAAAAWVSIPRRLRRLRADAAVLHHAAEIPRRDAK